MDQLLRYSWVVLKSRLQSLEIWLDDLTFLLLCQLWNRILVCRFGFVFRCLLWIGPSLRLSRRDDLGILQRYRPSSQGLQQEQIIQQKLRKRCFFLNIPFHNFMVVDYDRQNALAWGFWIQHGRHWNERIWCHFGRSRSNSLLGRGLRHWGVPISLRNVVWSIYQLRHHIVQPSFRCRGRPLIIYQFQRGYLQNPICWNCLRSTYPSNLSNLHDLHPY